MAGRTTTHPYTMNENAMKYLPAAIVLLLCCAGQNLWAQQGTAKTVDASRYYVSDPDPTTIWIYRLGELAFLDVYAAKLQRINGVDYLVRIRKYSTGTYDTAYYRAGMDGFYRGIPLANGRGVRESLVLPRHVYVGMQWLEADSSWSYQVTAVGDSLTTPAATYGNLIEVTATPVGAAAANAKVNRMYFAQDIGLVAYTVEGKIAAYLRSMRKVTGRQKAADITPE